MKKVLVVEDNDTNLRLIQFILESLGAKVIVAFDGVQAVALATREKPDLILMDIQIPIMDGLECTRRIRETDDRVPIIAITSYAMKGDREKALEAGCTDYVEKPIQPERFVPFLKGYL